MFSPELLLALALQASGIHNGSGGEHLCVVTAVLEAVQSFCEHRHRHQHRTCDCHPAKCRFGCSWLDVTGW